MRCLVYSASSAPHRARLVRVTARFPLYGRSPARVPHLSCSPVCLIMDEAPGSKSPRGHTLVLLSGGSLGIELLDPAKT